MPGAWHQGMQDMFDKSHQEVKFELHHYTVDDKFTQRTRYADVCKDECVVEYQHSRITREEVNGRNSDYETRLGKQVVWVIDCTGNAQRPYLVQEASESEDDIWLIPFERKWHVDSMRDCKILFADFDGRIFRIPVECVAKRMVAVYGSWGRDQSFVDHLTSAIDVDVRAPLQSTVSLRNDPPGSGKTYGLTRQLIFTEREEYKRFAIYRCNIFVTKPHAAKEVLYAEFMTHLRSSGLPFVERAANNKYVVEYTRGDGETVMCIFGTADSLMYNLAENRMSGTDHFIDLVRTIHAHGPTKLQGPYGRFNYAGERPALNARTMILVDEAAMFPEAYADAFATLADVCHADIHFAGDVQQSTSFDNNLMTRVLREGEATFPRSNIVMHSGNEIRRFGPELVAMRNTLMRGFYENPSHGIPIQVPVAATDVSHARGEYSIDFIAKARPHDEDAAKLNDVLDVISARLRSDAMALGLLPNDLMIVFPFVNTNVVLDALQPFVHDFWVEMFADAEYIAKVRSHAGYAATCEHFSQTAKLGWYCVAHRSEDFRPIDTRESIYATRMVSIQSSQGDGRKVVYVIGLSESALKKFTNGQISLKYESLLNVATSRQKEVVRFFFEDTPNDVLDRFRPLMDDATRAHIEPVLAPKPKYMINKIALNPELLDPELYKTAEPAVRDSATSDQKPLVDNAHHNVRMAAMNTMFQARTLNTSPEYGRTRIVFGQVATYRIQVMKPSDYWRELNKNKINVIPILKYNDGSSMFESVHSRIVQIMREVQHRVKQWIIKIDNRTDVDGFGPEHCVVLQYVVDILTKNDGVKMDQLYDIVKSYMQSDSNHLSSHYDYLQNCEDMYDRITEASGEQFAWTINRSVELDAECFDIKAKINHLCYTDTKAFPIILCPSIDKLNLPVMCAQAILYTFVCLQPRKDDPKAPTWQLLSDRDIVVCFAPLLHDTPVFVDMASIVRENMGLITELFGRYIENDAQLEISAALNVARHYPFADARRVIMTAWSHNPPLCSDFVKEAFTRTNDRDNVDKIEKKMRKAMREHLECFKGSIMLQ